jgi:hypothetical protein
MGSAVMDGEKFAPAGTKLAEGAGSVMTVMTAAVNTCRSVCEWPGGVAGAEGVWLSARLAQHAAARWLGFFAAQQQHVFAETEAAFAAGTANTPCHEIRMPTRMVNMQVMSLNGLAIFWRGHSHSTNHYTSQPTFRNRDYRHYLVMCASRNGS